MNRITCFFISTLLLLLANSCNDVKLAQALDGRWEAKYVHSFSDGEKDTIVASMTFIYDEDESDYDGVFWEDIYCKTNELDDDDYTYSFSYRSSISGTYEVLGGDLYLVYDLSSLEVTLDAKDINLKPKGFDSAWNMLGQGLYSYLNNNESIESSLAKELKKAIYKSQFELYQYNSSEDVCNSDLTIEENVMSYNTESGKIRYKRDLEYDALND